MTIKICSLMFPVGCMLFFGCSSFFKFQKPPILISGVAISLKNLTENVKTSLDSHDSISNILNNFCGMNRIYGYAIDEKDGDIILIGGKMKPSNEITLDDFAISLRNVWQETTPPGCSIDPRLQEMVMLDSLMIKINKWHDEFYQDRILSNWKKKAGFQSVRVLGIQKNSSFAKTLIDADYIMKKISNGSHPMRLKGFKSFNQMILEADEKEFRKNGLIENRKILCRFWFSPDENKFITTTNALYLKNSSVKLQTEEEYWNDNEERIGRGNPHPVAQEFVKSFSSKYQEIANREPIYSELETLFRLVVIQKILKNKVGFDSLQNALDFWLNQYPINIVKTDDSVKAIYTYKRHYSTIGDKNLTLLSPMAGGVSISPEISDKCFESDLTGFVSNLSKLALNSRPNEKSAYWYFDFPDFIRNKFYEKQRLM